jgi:peptide/nickel transport system permease protein
MIESKKIWQHLKQHKIALVSFWMIAILIFIALLASIIATDVPYYVSINNKSYFPILHSGEQLSIVDEHHQSQIINIKQTDWKHFTCDNIIFAPIPYSANTSDYLNADYKAPSDAQLFETNDGIIETIPNKFKHFLGTNKRGEDVLSGLINGTRVSILVGFLSMLFAASFGIFMGAIAGYFGNDGIKISKAGMVGIIIGLLLGWFYAFDVRAYTLSDAAKTSQSSFMLELIFSLLIFAFIVIAFYLLLDFIATRFNLFYGKINLPLDTIISKLIEVIVSLPTVLIIISFAAIFKPSIFILIIIIAFVQWTQIARLVRAEMLKIKQLDYISAAKVLGFSPTRIIFKHALPNAIAPALVSIAFGVASAIIIESSLSFLGIGVPLETVTWGSMINAGRENFQAWWLVLFPGCCIFITVLSLNILGEAVRDAMDVKG